MSKTKKDELLDLATRIKSACETLAGLKEEVEKALADGKLFNPDSVSWIDLGLPSGRLWASENAEGYFNYDEARETFGDYLPTGTAMAELCEFCRWTWDDNREGYLVEGPNGNSIFLPAAGYKSNNEGEVKCKGGEGNYWTSMPVFNSQPYARRLYFSSGYINPLNDNYRSYGFSVRPSREKSF